ncbi:TonB-dependent siderophore receptor [Lewinella sp. W8]|uniref:TonB-dependent receptor plug domain-containing protein n=1 Tax=Lewinella sp. W8 TaxID=2528208 RepID=UPI00106835E3|nr:TonB-dependent receptor [Lewinella sp. W8]MTB52123.1 TonB-dependent receptor [Lewinella sp. W8]
MRFLLTTTFLFLCCGLSAQEVPTLSTTTDEVLVSTTKFPQAAEDSPQYVTVIDSTAILAGGDLAMLLQEQAGVVINGAYSNFGKDKSVFLRNAGNQYALILIDGIPVTDPSALGGAIDLRLLSLDNVRRIEILRGPRSLLYGSDAMAGVINIITKNSDTEDPIGLHLRAAAQTHNTFDGAVSVSGSTAKVDYRLAYDRFQSDGISEAAEPAGTTDAFDDDPVTRQNINASLRWQATQRLSLRPSLRIADFDGDYDDGAFTDGANTYTNDLILPGLRLDYAADKFRITGNYNYAKTDRVFNSAFGAFEGRGRSHQADLAASFFPQEKLFYTLGTQLREERLQVNDPGTDAPQATTISPFLQLGYRPSERLSLEGGFRFNQHSNFGGQSNWSLAGILSNRGGLSWRVSVASAFQSPTLDQLAGPFGANPDLQPQVATSLETGVSFQTEDQHLKLHLTGFRRLISDIIVFGTNGYENQDEQRDLGLEFSGDYRLNKVLTVSGNFTHVSGTLRQPNVPRNVEVRDFPRRPGTTATLSLNYQAPKAFSARITTQYVGDRPDLLFNPDFSTTLVTLDNYVLVNAYLQYQLLKRQQLTLFADLRNLTDTEFTEVIGFNTLGRMIRLGFSVDL